MNGFCFAQHRGQIIGNRILPPAFHLSVMPSYALGALFLRQSFLKVTGKHISNNAMLVFTKKYYTKSKITVHGFRATFRTWAEETGKYQHHAIEFCLAHQLPTKVEKSYLRTNLFQMRKVIMNDWEKYIMSY